MSNSLQPPWTATHPQAPLSMEFFRQQYRVGHHAFLQGIFPTQELNPGLLHCRQILHHLSCQGSRNLVGIVNVIEIIVVENVRGRIYI